MLNILMAWRPSTKELFSFFLLGCIIMLTITFYTLSQQWHPIIDEGPDILSIPEKAKEAITFSEIELKVDQGDTMTTLLKKAGLEMDDILKISKELNKYGNMRNLKIGQAFYVTVDNLSEKSNKLLALRTSFHPQQEIEIIRNDNNIFETKEVSVELEKRLVRTSGVIKNNLLSSTTELGIPSQIMMEAVKALSYDVDFQRDLQIGDRFDVLYDRFYTPDGKLARHGNPLYISLILGDKAISLYRYTTQNGIVDYFDKEGRSIKRQLLRTPINAARISSKFGMRKHPVLGYSKMHRGVDFAAPIGTPILSAGDGVVAEIGRKGSYGNYIRVKHNSEYSTAYGHAKSFVKGLKKGQHVKQGQIIAYVGKTGRCTGPHLHFEVLIKNKQVNPLKVKMSPGIKLAGKERKAFLAHAESVHSVLEQLPRQTEIVYQDRLFETQSNN